MNLIFANCNKLKPLPDSSKWNRRNVIKKNVMTIIYDIDNNKKKGIRIFGEKFVKNNKEKGLLLIKDKLYKLQDFYANIETEQKLTILLIEKELITDMSFMFSNCNSLLSLPDISKWNTINVTNMNSMFSDCNSLSTMPDISKWNTDNVTNISSMFSNCNILSPFPDISKWNTYNIIDMSFFFLIVYYYHLYLIYQNGIQIM